MAKLVKRDELIDRYLSDEERRGIDQFYKDMPKGASARQPARFNTNSTSTSSHT